MRRFQVSEKFAGQKGPCPKCGHIIEIPKEKVIIHAPDEIIVEGKKVKNPEFVRPIERESFSFTRRQIIVNIVGACCIVLFAYLFHFLGSGIVKWSAATLGILVTAFALARTSYILVRNPDDLEIFLGRELFRKSAFTAIGYTIAWLVLEVFLFYFNPGLYVVLFLVPIVFLASFIPLIFFDTDYSDSCMLFIVFVLVIVLLRGIMFAPEGWIWKPVSKFKQESTKKELGIEDFPTTTVAPDEQTEPETVTEQSPLSPREKPKLSREAPNTKELLKQR